MRSIFATAIFLVLFAFAMPVLAADPAGGGPGNCVDQHRRDAVCTESTETTPRGTTLYCTSCEMTCNNNSTYTGKSCTPGNTEADKRQRKNDALGQAWRKGNQPKPKSEACIAARPGSLAGLDNRNSVISAAARGVSNVVSQNSLSPRNRLSLPLCEAW